MPELKPCPFCGCHGDDLENDGVYINHECIKTGAIEWNDWNSRPREERLEALLAHLKEQATPLNLSVSGWIGIPTVEWEAVMEKWEALR